MNTNTLIKNLRRARGNGANIPVFIEIEKESIS
jgi:hypothetical protein